MAKVALSPQYPFPLPQCLTYPSATPPELITQGAEGRLYKTSYISPSIPCALKHRPPKQYRHPVLDQRLTRHRILSEARILVKCRREGVLVPAVYHVDERAGTLTMEWIAGEPVRVRVNDWLRRRKEAGGQDEQPVLLASDADADRVVGLMRRIGAAVGRLHKVGIIHGDLTTSNMMVRACEGGGATASDADPEGEGARGEPDAELDGDIVMIDFGLASQGSSDEDRAVDLYVLERAFASTHPRAEALFSIVLDAYKSVFKQGPVVLRRLEDVRMRGRKRSMLG